MPKKDRIRMPVGTADRPFLERFRIHNILEKAVERPVLIISAGEGYGKTYAVSSFLRRRPETAIWIRFSDRDNHPWRFWENYTRVMGRCKEAAGKELRDVGFPETTWQFEKWYEIDRREFSYPGKYVIVCDNFHAVKSKEVVDFIDRAIGRPIPNHTLILICRTDPAMNILPLMAKGRLARIDADDLLFTKKETAEYLQMYNLGLSDEEITAVHHDTEGWPFALDMVVNGIQKAGGRYNRFSSRQGAFRAFKENLFASVPGELQRYLVKLSFFEQWPMELLERTAVSLPKQYRKLPALLAELEKLGALIRYDYYLQGYQIHQAFLDFLREKQDGLPRQEVKEISIIAAHWCIENNLKMDAVINFERAGDYAGITGIIDTFPRIIPGAIATPLLGLIERLMQHEDRDDADQHYIYLSSVIRGRLLMCLARFDEATSVFYQNIRQFEALPPAPFNGRVLAESWSFLGIIALIQRRYNANESYAHCLEQADRYYQQYPWPLSRSMTFCNVGSYANQISYPAGPGEIERRIRTFCECAPNSLNGNFSVMGDLARTEFAYFQGDLNVAEQYARRTIIKAKEENQCEIELRSFFLLLRIGLHRGSPEELLELWKQKDSILKDESYLNRTIVSDIIDGWMYTQMGEQEKIASWLRRRLEPSDIYSILHNLESLVKAKYLFAEGQYAETVSFLNLKENRERLGSFLMGMIEMNCLEAAAHYHLGDKTAAIALLEKTYEAAAPNSLNMPFIEMGNDMRFLVSAALNTDSAIPRSWLEEIRNLASAYGKNLFTISEQLKGREAAGTTVYLTRLERTVLNGLSRGQTRNEIASVLGQPLSAVKSLITRICVKLGAVNRADAIRIASNMGILGTNER
jgi:LuxR family maltose regulon positive regulatory protein